MPNVIIIEDDEFLVELLAKKLADEGIDVEKALNGEVGVQKVLQMKPEVVLLDLLLPGLDGFGVLEKIRQSTDEQVKGTTVLILSNYGEEEMISRAQALGISEYMVKANFSTTDILDKVKEYLGPTEAAPKEEGKEKEEEAKEAPKKVEKPAATSKPKAPAAPTPAVNTNPAAIPRAKTTSVRLNDYFEGDEEDPLHLLDDWLEA